MGNKIYFYLIIISIAVTGYNCSDSGTGAAPPPGGTLSRNGIFFHHSTGENIWGPNGSTTSVPEQITAYNTSHNLTGNSAFSMTELWWPNNPNDNNEWERWHRIFAGQDANANITPYYSSHRIIMIKSCFPSSEINDEGIPEDTLNPEDKTIFNYKWHWRFMVRTMRNHPTNFFVIWTNAPLTQLTTNPTQAHFSDRFCKWAKDTLAAGLDPLIGTFPSNVYVFDYFHKLADANGYLPDMYAVDPYDSHPNAAATQLVAPLLVNETLNAYLASGLP